ncbi:MAG: hypothetical protein IKI95_03930 [Clostridia bacterium]|nr:hypothetical protein [Clostridia bacterium]
MSIELIIVLLVVVFIGSIILLNLPKIKKAVAKKSSKKKAKKKKKKESEKLKVSKVVEQIRPILKPADDEKAERENKEIEAKREGKQLPPPNEVKAIDFKYSANNNRKSVLNSLDDYDSKKNASVGFTGPSFARNNQNNASPYSISVNKKPNPLNRDIKKEFEDIRKFLDLPENKNGGNLQQKYEATKAANAIKQNPINSFKNSNKIDASLFNEPASHYADYRKKDNFLSENSVSDDFNVNSNLNLNTMQTKTKYSRPTQYEPVVDRKNKGYTYKINRDTSSNVANKLNLNYDRDEYLNFEEENIDLNKLSPKLKRLIITNILNRKKFD